MRVHTLFGLQRFHSPWSYRAHALSSVAKSSLSKLDMAKKYAVYLDETLLYSGVENGHSNEKIAEKQG